MIIGFIGLGTMGKHAAANIWRKEFDLVIHDIRPEAAAPLVAMGATAAESPATVLDAVEVVVTMVFGPKEVEQVMRGPAGFLSGDPAGKVRIEMTTSSPFLMRELAAEFEACGGHAVDAPFTGSMDAAIWGDMPVFVGGTDAVIE
ncbi:MAG: NAD(P)-binding domain-containing protein [Rhodobacterales bacterium]|jgi:3-hydroxyisobutyrate dehydrogenase-like beta-hydroxyacid dehydrogenase|nr:NAD(P)-binding domain-containing protein [Rhodobacterales bacterium]